MAKNLFSKVGLLVKAKVRHAVGGALGKSSRSRPTKKNIDPRPPDPATVSNHQYPPAEHDNLSEDALDEDSSEIESTEDDLASRRSRLAKPDS